MANLETKYLGLDIQNPIIVGASEITNSVESIKKYKNAGAIVLKSLFEEQILMDINSERVNNISGTYDHIENYIGYYLKKHTVTNYLNLIKEAKQAVDIPIIASINCFDDAEWIDFATKIQAAGADALEVNLFIMPANVETTGRDLEQRYIDIIEKLLKVVDIPVSIKLGSYFSGLANFLVKLSNLDIKGLVLFNKFYSPKIDINSEKVVSGINKTTSHDNANVLRWLGILSDKVNCDLSASTGIHTSEDVISNLLVGATTTQMVSSFMINGDNHLAVILKELEKWMESKNYNSIEEFKGKLNQKNIKNPMMLERSQFMRYFTD
ncbi:MAG: dihydroorotate dehydrogenase-like protein [Bacteroidales bacterium]|nr:dihydroorotate dehydrogenase-like protein [Bacteroidales bacterium]